MRRLVPLLLCLLGGVLGCGAPPVQPTGPEQAVKWKHEPLPAPIVELKKARYKYDAQENTTEDVYGFQIRLFSGGMLLLPADIARAMTTGQPLPVQNWRKYATIVKRKDQFGWAFGHLDSFSTDDATLKALFSTALWDTQLVVLEDKSVDSFQLCDLVDVQGVPRAELWVERRQGLHSIRLLPKLISRNSRTEPREIRLTRNDNATPPKVTLHFQRPQGSGQNESVSDPVLVPATE